MLFRIVVDIYCCFYFYWIVWRYPVGLGLLEMFYIISNFFKQLKTSIVLKVKIIFDEPFFKFFIFISYFIYLFRKISHELLIINFSKVTFNKA